MTKPFDTAIGSPAPAPSAPTNPEVRGPIHTVPGNPTPAFRGQTPRPHSSSEQGAHSWSSEVPSRQPQRARLPHLTTEAPVYRALASLTPSPLAPKVRGSIHTGPANAAPAEVRGPVHSQSKPGSCPLGSEPHPQSPREPGSPTPPKVRRCIHKPQRAQLLSLKDRGPVHIALASPAPDPLPQPPKVRGPIHTAPATPAPAALPRSEAPSTSPREPDCRPPMTEAVHKTPASPAPARPPPPGQRLCPHSPSDRSTQPQRSEPPSIQPQQAQLPPPRSEALSTQTQGAQLRPSQVIGPICKSQQGRLLSFYEAPSTQPQRAWLPRPPQGQMLCPKAPGSGLPPSEVRVPVHTVPGSLAPTAPSRSEAPSTNPSKPGSRLPPTGSVPRTPASPASTHPGQRRVHTAPASPAPPTPPEVRGAVYMPQ